MDRWEQAKAEVGGLETGLDGWEWEMSVCSRDELQGALVLSRICYLWMAY